MGRPQAGDGRARAPRRHAARCATRLSADLHAALDRIERELAAELPPHVRAFARAHVAGRPPPPAPLIARLASTLELARTAAQTAELAERGRALLRLVAPIAIEAAPAVADARSAAPSWAGLAALADARDREARARFGCRAIELFHRLHGIGASPAELGADRVPWLRDLPAQFASPFPAAAPPPTAPSPAVPPPVAGWQERDGDPLDAAAIAVVWRAIAARLGVRGVVHIERGAEPRTFVVEPGREVIAVIPEIVASPAARSAVLHELGHAAAALATPGRGIALPRLVDEAAASAIARLAERPGDLPPPWPSGLAAAARRRRAAIAALLDAIERHLPALPATPPSVHPPPALWHDPGAQAAYARAEAG